MVTFTPPVSLAAEAPCYPFSDVQKIKERFCPSPFPENDSMSLSGRALLP